MSSVFIKHTLDGRKVEVIGRHLCLDGRPEADRLVPIDEHPNRQAIQQAVPLASHVGGRLPLTLAQASVAQAALRQAQETDDSSPRAISERLRSVVWRRSQIEGAE